MKLLAFLLFTLMAVHLGTCHVYEPLRYPFGRRLEHHHSAPVFDTQKPVSLTQNPEQRYPPLENRQKRNVWWEVQDYPIPVPHEKKF